MEILYGMVHKNRYCTGSYLAIDNHYVTRHFGGNAKSWGESHRAFLKSHLTTDFSWIPCLVVGYSVLPLVR